jgi:hypothetical protein
MEVLKMKKYSVNPTFNFSDEDMIGIISSAVYDIGYWGGVHDTNEYYEARDELNKEDRTYEDILLHMLKKGDKILMYDVEDEFETWDLTLDKLLNGIKLTIENGYWNGDMDEIDGEVGDIIFQHALFNEIVYG